MSDDQKDARKATYTKTSTSQPDVIPKSHTTLGSYLQKTPGWHNWNRIIISRSNAEENGILKVKFYFISSRQKVGDGE